MNVIVCVKQIPDPAMPGELNGSTNTLKREGKLILDESDSYGVEMALQLVGKAGGGEVKLFSALKKQGVDEVATLLATHDAGGVTRLDLDLAKAMNAIAKQLGVA
mgnify:CR=1 FL=1